MWPVNRVPTFVSLSTSYQIAQTASVPLASVRVVRYGSIHPVRTLTPSVVVQA
jgi:hypothetical protein